MKLYCCRIGWHRQVASKRWNAVLDLPRWVEAVTRGPVEKISADGNKQVAASTTAPANTTTSAAVAQLGPHAGFERRRFVH